MTEKKTEENNEEITEPTATPDDRGAFLESLADKAMENRSEEMIPVEDEEVDETAVDEPEETGTDEVVDEEVNEPEEQMIEVVVDGVAQKIPLSQVVDAGKRTLQKETAADKRLEEATRLLKEAKERQPSEKIEDVDEGPSELELANEELNRARKAYAKAQTGVDEDEIETALTAWEEAQAKVWSLKNKGPDIDEIERRVFPQPQKCP